MSISFTNDQLKTMSGDLLVLPGKINDPNSGLIAQKAAYAGQAVTLKATDDNQKIFSDSWIATVGAYHGELVQLNDEQRTGYDPNAIVLAAQGDKSTAGHFPASPTTWVNLTPKVLDSNKGLPTTTAVSPIESDLVTRAQSLINTLINGFSSGSASDTGTLTGTTIQADDETTDFHVNDQLYVHCHDGSVVFGVITSVDTTHLPGDPSAMPPVDPSDVTSIGFSVSSGTPSDGVCSFQNFVPGFSDAQRSGTTPLTPYADLYAAEKLGIQTAITAWQTCLQAQQTALGLNNDLDNTAHVAAALASVNAALAVITTWVALPDLQPNGLLTDNGLAPLNARLAARATAIPARITQIHTDVGSLSQNSDGTFTGAGAYWGLFKLVDVRCALGTGTLTKYYDNVRNQGLFDKQIANYNTQISQYQAVMYVSKILADTTAGLSTFGLDTVTGLSNGDAVLVMDDSSITYSRTISGISGTNVTINTGIPIILTAAKFARIVKVK